MKTLGKAFSGQSILFTLLDSFVVLPAVLLIVLAYLANRNLNETGVEAFTNIEEMGQMNLSVIEQLRKKVLQDAVQALHAKSTEAIEVRTVDLANAIAAFLYERDNDARPLASISQLENNYLSYFR